MHVWIKVGVCSDKDNDCVWIKGGGVGSGEVHFGIREGVFLDKGRCVLDKGRCVFG